MKKICTALLAVMLLFALAATGCAQSQQQDVEEPTGQEGVQGVQSNDSDAESAEQEQADVSTDAIATPSTAGALQVVGSQLCDHDGNPVQLRGVSTHGLAWYPGYVNREFFQQLRTDWNANVVRMAMYTAESGGYCTGGDQAGLYDLVRAGVGYAADADLYAIVDWHILSDGNPLQNADAAADFFARISADLADRNNVIYEICNEPNGGTQWADIKAYAERIIPIIRANDPDAVIIVGTPTWSQEVDEAAAQPLDTENVMYALHFYAATHKDDLRDRMASAVQAGLPVFVSEFGICDASGNGSIDYGSANAWVSAMDQLGVSYVCWNLSNKDEASALFKSSCTKTSGFAADDLSAEGTWLWGVLHGEGGAASAEGESTTSGFESASTTSVPIQSDDGAMTWTAKQVNSWSSNGRYFYQYSLEVANHGDAAVDGWEIRLPLSDSVDVSDSWNATVSADGNALVLRSVSYNGSLSPNATATDVGFIVSSNSSQLKIGE